ncbi:ubiquitin-like domain-containing protein [Anaerovorax odorimutans]|uniref:ubiquitin-like domain-containing protein n=1 Tax=Anaerovorax odorimutans TaxID=109327 RepID=UPI002730A1BD|nr:ubiquitin-like domain-containing protein [Anaerovorax odorimutans]
MIKKLADHKMLIICLGMLLVIIALAFLLLTQLVSKEVRLVVDGQTQAIETNSYDVAELLEENNIELVKEDSVTPSIDKPLTDGAEVKVRKAVEFTLQADGKTEELKALPKTVGDALKYHKIKVGEADKVSPALNEPLTAGAQIVINRITTAKEEVTEEIDFKTKTKGDNDLPAGTTKVVKKGEKGQDRVVYEITYSDGKEIARRELERETISKPVNKLVAKSTRGTIQGKEYTKKFTVKAYSYTGGGRTAMGTQARVGEIAVDPSVIPLGTRVYVEGYGFARAEDTGGNIKGNTIDVYKNSESECLNWGVRNVTIYILSE